MPTLSSPQFSGSFQATYLSNSAKKAMKSPQLPQGLGKIAKDYQVEIKLNAIETTEKVQSGVFRANGEHVLPEKPYTAKAEPTTYIDIRSNNKRNAKQADNAVLALLKRLVPDVELPKTLNTLDEDRQIKWSDSDITFKYTPDTVSDFSGCDPDKRW